MTRSLVALFVLATAIEARAADPPAAGTARATAALPAPVLALPVAQQTPGERDRRDLRFVLGEHPSLRWGRWLQLDLRGRVQVDSRNPGDEPRGFDTFGLHRARLGVDGELFGIFQFSVEREMTEFELDAAANPAGRGSKTPWKDVWAELNLGNPFQLRGGRFKIPFGLDQLTSVSENDFIYRSQGGNFLSPARDIGVMAHGRFFGRRLNYDVGVFEQDGDNSRSSKVVGGDRTLAARIVGRPLTATKTLNLDQAEVGVSFATTDVSDESVLPNGLRGRTVLSKYTYFEPVFVKGTRNRYGVDVDWRRGPVGARAEFIAVNDDRKEQGLRSNTLNPARARAWYVSGAWVVFGARKERPVLPERALFVQGAGAIELVARYERMRFSSEPTGEPAFTNSRAEVILPNGNRVVTLGANWFFNRWTKVQFNAMRESLDDAGRTPFVDGRTSFWSTVFRAQISL